MRVFLCSYSWFLLAIPTDFISSIFLYQENLNQKIEFNAENRNTSVCLPLLFDCPDSNVKHGIIIKNDTDNDSTENRFVLFGTAVESERDIPAESIFPVPKIMGVMQFSFIFDGICFFTDNSNEGENKINNELVLLLNPQKLIQNIQKELIK